MLYAAVVASDIQLQMANAVVPPLQVQTGFGRAGSAFWAFETQVGCALYFQFEHSILSQSRSAANRPQWNLLALLPESTISNALCVRAAFTAVAGAEPVPILISLR